MKLLRLEFYKCRRRRITLICAGILAAQLLWFGAYLTRQDPEDLAQGWMLMLYNLALVDAILLPVGTAAVASRNCEIEHKGATLKLLETAVTPGRLYDAKLVWGALVLLALMAVRTALFTALGVWEEIRPGMKVVLKPNLVMSSKPEAAIATHPALVAAVGKCVQKAGGKVLIAESPGGPYTPAAMKAVFRGCGYTGMAKDCGFALYTECKSREVTLPGARRCKQLSVAEPFLTRDYLIDLCKLKTHGMVGFSGAVKNLFGVIPGLSKVGYHATHPDHETFADVLLDLTGYVKPRLSLMDGILAMEGDGPGSSGTPRQAGLLLAAANPLALDTAAGAIMNLPRQDNPVLLAAERRGLTPCRMEDVELIGGTVEELRMADYKFPASTKSNLMDFLGPLARPAERLCKKALSQTPRIDGAKCVGCGICAKSCPGQAIAMTAPGKKARISQKACIHCYCCHELCPQKAVELHQSWLGRLLTK